MYNKKYNGTQYEDENHKSWFSLYNNQIAYVRDKAEINLLKNLEVLSLPTSHIPDLLDVSQTLKKITGWEIVGVEGLVETLQFFKMLSKKQFPSTIYIRGSSASNLSYSPDIFHELFGHIPILMNDKHSEYVQKFGQLCLEFNEREVALLQRLYWFSYEMGLITTKEGLKIYGASLMSSYDEVKHAFSDKAVIKPFSLLDILRTPYRDDMVQSVYFKLSSFEELFEVLEDVKCLRSTINSAYYMGEYYPSFSTVNPTAGSSIGRCKFTVDVE